MTFSCWVQARKAYKRPATAPLRPVPSPNSVPGRRKPSEAPILTLIKRVMNATVAWSTPMENMLRLS